MMRSQNNINLKYKDIMELERPASAESKRKHPRMPLSERAKIFAPFAALRGHKENLEEEERICELDEIHILTEEEQERIAMRIAEIESGKTITIRYFQPDEQDPSIGKVLKKTGMIKKTAYNLKLDDIELSYFQILEIL